MDHRTTNQWLKRAGLKSEIDGFIIAAHDQAIKTNYYSSKILKDGTDQTQCAEFVVNFRELLTILWQGALSWPKLAYRDTIKPQHTLENLQRDEYRHKREMVQA